MTELTCPLCGAIRCEEFLNRSKVPVLQHQLVKERRAAREVPCGDLVMVVCLDCGFVFNSEFESSKQAYCPDYDNNQSYSPLFDEYMNELVCHLVEEREVRNKVIVEVGCGKGDFLRKLVNYPETNNRGLGFDPSYEGTETENGGSLVFHRRYFGPDSADCLADVVICRHVIEHVQEPVALLESIKSALVKSSRARVFLETPCVEWILKNKVIWDFFYEHCSLFSVGSLTTAFERAGFSVETILYVFGGQYLWFEAIPAYNVQSVSLQPGNVPAMASSFNDSEAMILANLRNRLITLYEKGPVSLWGAGAKGATFANLIDPECRLIDCVVDVNPNKQGKYLPGTGHPIVDYHELPERGVRNVLLMNSNYHDENLKLLATAGVVVNLIDWN